MLLFSFPNDIQTYRVKIKECVLDIFLLQMGQYIAANCTLANERGRFVWPITALY